jgi:hypothetical protein
MSIRVLCLALVATLVVGCTTPRLPSAGFADRAALERAMKRYYEAHATERYGYCLTPYIDGLTQVSVVDQQPERMVVDVRYLYRDWSKNDNSGGFGRECTNYAGRRFTLAKGPSGGVEVVDMTGTRRS